MWECINNFFDTLPLAATIDKTIFCVHGGIPRALCEEDATLDLIAQVPLANMHAHMHTCTRTRRARARIHTHTHTHTHECIHTQH